MTVPKPSAETPDLPGLADIRPQVLDVDGADFADTIARLREQGAVVPSWERGATNGGWRIRVWWPLSREGDGQRLAKPASRQALPKIDGDPLGASPHDTHCHASHAFATRLSKSRFTHLKPYEKVPITSPCIPVTGSRCWQPGRPTWHDPSGERSRSGRLFIGWAGGHTEVARLAAHARRAIHAWSDLGRGESEVDAGQSAGTGPAGSSRRRRACSDIAGCAMRGQGTGLWQEMRHGATGKPGIHDWTSSEG